MPDLLMPLSPARPCGDDLSFSSEFDEIQELRREDDPTLDQGEWVTAVKAADWAAVVQRCEQLLGERTKDLRLLAWRTEALARTRGFSGLAAGLADCAQACDTLWDTLHPQAEGDDQEQRAGTVRWLLAQVQRLARTLPATQAPSGRFSLADFDEARALQTAMEREPDRAAALSEGKTTWAQVQRARRDTPATVLRDNVAAAAAALQHLQALQQQLDPRLGDDAPSFVHARQAMEDAHHALERLAREAGALGSTTAASGAQAGAASAAGSDALPDGGGEFLAPATSGGPLRHRAQALQQLREVADFFRRTEPHSPVALLAEKAARWGEMPLDVWLREVVKDAGSLAHLEELLGMAPRADDLDGNH